MALKEPVARDNLPAVDLTFCFRFMIKDAYPLLRHSGTGTKLILNLKILSSLLHAFKPMALATAVAACLLRLILLMWSATKLKGRFHGSSTSL
jgi:hypothetical protein